VVEKIQVIMNKNKELRKVVFIVLLVLINFQWGLTGCSVTQEEPKLQLMGNRFFTFNTVVRVNQIETSRDEANGEDESSIHSPAEARVFREAVERAWPGARMT
jgi:hypothetical protein